MSAIFFQNKFYPKAKRGNSFDQEFAFHHERGVAFESHNTFFSSGINHGGDLHYVKKSDTPSDNIQDWVAKSFGDTKPIESTYELGTCYKRIWRPLVCSGSFHKAISQEKLNESFVSLRILLSKLEDLFETVEPCRDNLNTYGLKIREVILLACMEVESSWTAVLKENNYSNSSRLTTKDYVKLKQAMFLDAYELSLQSYPGFPSLTPFKNWDLARPTESLVWYDAYNRTKHDREENLRFATLENAVYAVGATVVMFYAQFGPNFGLISVDPKSTVIRNVFKFITKDLVKYETEFYIPKVELEADSGKPSPSWEWVLADYNFT